MKKNRDWYTLFFNMIRVTSLKGKQKLSFAFIVGLLSHKLCLHFYAKTILFLTVDLEINHLSKSLNSHPHILSQKSYICNKNYKNVSSQIEKFCLHMQVQELNW